MFHVIPNSGLEQAVNDFRIKFSYKNFDENTNWIICILIAYKIKKKYMDSSS